MRLFFTFLFLTFSIFDSYSQTQFWSDTFEDAGSPSSGTRTPSSTFYASTERYYDRVTTAQVNTTTTYTSFQGSKFWGGADVDNRTGQNTQSAHQNITWSSINISGESDLTFKGLFAIGNIANFDHFPGSSPIDYMLVEYRIDGGAWTSLVRFFPNLANNGAGALALETTGDSLAAGEGAALSGTFTEFSGNISGTGTLLDVRFKSGNNGTSFEEIAADNFRLFSGTALPVKWIDFTGKNSSGENTLSWITANEQNNELFEIERSNDGIAFEKIGTLQGSGTSNTQQHYSYSDVSFSSAANLYYRLRQVDLDGRAEYSKIISINPGFKINIYPNPVLNVFTIELNESIYPNPKIQLLDMSGKYLTVELQRTGTYNYCNIDNLPKGLYILKVSNENSVQTEVIIKQ